MSNPLARIYNYLQIDTMWASSGQPNEEELRQVATAGYRAVINLALHDAEYSLADEPGLVQSLNMEYVHIPVDWQRPTDRDLNLFFAAMQRLRPQKVFLHCAANMRASVFSALYLFKYEQWPTEATVELIHSIWKPNAVWQEFFKEHAGI